MSVQLSDLAGVKSYFTALAVSHVDINDTIIFGNLDVMENESKSTTLDKVLWVEEYDKIDFKGESIDNLMKHKTFKVVYLLRPTSELFADRQAAKVAAEVVISQLIARMRRDKNGETNAAEPLFLANLDEWKMELGEWNISGGVLMCGCSLEISYFDNTGFVYVPAKWV